MLRPFLIVSTLTVLGLAALSQQSPSAPATPPAAAPSQSAIPAEDAAKVNPVKPTPESQARAKQIYGWDCAMCHAENGDGKGDVAAEQKLTMHDFHDSLNTLSDGEIFYIIHNGKGKDMPGEGPRAKPDEVWNLVIYLRKMSGTHGPSAQPSAAQSAATQPPA